MFGDSGELYIHVAGNTNAGVPGRLSSSRLLKDNVLSGSTLVADIFHPDFDGDLIYDTPDNGSLIGGKRIEIFSYGLRNPFGMVLHSNGNSKRLLSFFCYVSHMFAASLRH